ncbi:MAG: hypothetical protein G01um101417_612 [Parcubacteria group bacterium Gr01-1014_17]|nr:MAG: hypothetical protein G01um101417_612 [Parcubacteria group bacterium Gr01-1014_17]
MVFLIFLKKEPAFIGRTSTVLYLLLYKTQAVINTRLRRLLSGRVVVYNIEYSMERGTTKTMATGAFVLVALAFGAFLLRGNFGGQGFDSTDVSIQSGRRSEILELASRGARVSDSEKKRLFEYLSGEQFREYQFNDRERALILKAIGG